MEKIGIIGVGFVGKSIYDCFKNKNIFVKGYDKYKNIDTFEDCLNCDCIFLCLPTQFDESLNRYDTSILLNCCKLLDLHTYEGLIIIKSTVEPGTTMEFFSEFKNLHLVHNPEFLSAKTALKDFENQTHIVIGNCSGLDNQINELNIFYKKMFPKAEISNCNSTESESMKIFCNSFYAVKIQFFTELFLLCNKMECDYDKIKDMMVKNNWINPMHTMVPGPDGNISYGGLCFPKDTRALLSFMDRNKTLCGVLMSSVEEQKILRKENLNIIKSDLEKETD